MTEAQAPEIVQSGDNQPVDTRVAEIGRQILEERRIPAATYRLQFAPGFGFRDAAALVPYLHDLGITDCYASPILKSGPGGHGYDICDPSQLNPELGTPEDFEAFVAALHERAMGLLLDTVPNHMGITGTCNAWWMDVAENGPSSVYAPYFDIEWNPVKPELANKLLLPILEDQYGNVLESGKLQLTYADSTFAISYYDVRLPMSPRTYTLILSQVLERASEVLPKGDEHLTELQSIITALSYLPPRTETDPAKLEERQREKEVVKRRLANLYAASPDIRVAVDATLEAFNGTPGDPHSFDLLDGLIEAQVARPAFWRVAAEEINYRRFFDINNLAAVRVELPEVYHATHQLILRLLAEGKVTGLRIDHPDGLWDPARYFRRLQDSYVLEKVRARLAGADGHDGNGNGASAATVSDTAFADGLESAAAAWLDHEMSGNGTGARGTGWPLYVVAEKILSEKEPLPQNWAVFGTTGYDFLNAVNGLFVDGRNERAFDKIYEHFAGPQPSFRELMILDQTTVMRDSLSSEINMLSHQIERIGERNRHYRDFTLNGLTSAVREFIARLPIYRTYINAMTGEVSERDREVIESTTANAKRHNRRIGESLFDFLRDTLLLRNLDQFAEADRADVRFWVMRFQQLTGPVMAKGVEDTAFYQYNRLVSLNDVGGDPGQFGLSVAGFHRQNMERLKHWPHAMLTTSTHDTKRSEDVRARIDVLSELPDWWQTVLHHWARLNARARTEIHGEPAPDRNDEYLIYQTLLGTAPFRAVEEVMPITERPARGSINVVDLDADRLDGFRERIVGYMQKAIKEAKVHTSWINPNRSYDEAAGNFVSRILTADKDNRFLANFLVLGRRVAFYGQFNSLSQTLLKLTSPGVPDIYQGAEMWDFSLVDPDNRRPVDYAQRRAALYELRGRVAQAEQTAGQDAPLLGLAEDLLRRSVDGTIKLYVTYRTLTFRREHRDLFERGAYVPLEASGDRREHVVAFARTAEGEAVVVAVPRLVAGLTGGSDQPPVGAAAWGDLQLVLPDDMRGGRFRNLFTGEVLEGKPGLALRDVFAAFPVAVLVRD